MILPDLPCTGRFLETCHGQITNGIGDLDVNLPPFGLIVSSSLLPMIGIIFRFRSKKMKENCYQKRNFSMQDFR